jgi:hypothetical protein
MAAETFEARLAELKREVRKEWRSRVRSAQRFLSRPRARRDVLTSAVIGLLKLTAVIALPFILYVRASVFLYVHGWVSWLAVAGATLLTMGLVAGYAVWLSRRLAGQARAARMIRWVALPLAAAWCCYAVLYLEPLNAKSEDVRAYYRMVHPVLRVAIATAVLVDPDAVVTDLGRVREDYRRMGLPVNDRTLHYRQKDGWVHAVDLRTRERGEIRNRALQFYFWMMGFKTLRHVGTADHLHVQLALAQ